MTEHRLAFDFAITFTNTGELQGQGFRLDIEGDEIDDATLAERLVGGMRLRMVDRVVITNKRYLTEPREQTSAPHVEGRRLVDLSHPIHDGMITYPGLPGPKLRAYMSREQSRSHYAEGTEFHIGAIDMVANTGTYIDAPFHRYADGYDISAIPLDRVAGVPGVVVGTMGRAIDAAALADTETSGRAVLISTGWDSHFGQADYLGEHPFLTEPAARRLAEGGALVVGIDSANIDDTSTGSRPAHSLLLRHGIPVIEHLTRLDQLPDGPFELIAIPAPVVGMGTFPIRAVARW